MGTDIVEDSSQADAAASIPDDAGGASGGYGSGLVGGILDAIIGPVMSNVQAGRSSRAARHARAWSEYMASTAYQRTVKDLEAAGINPLYAVTRGATSAPSGPMAQVPDIPKDRVVTRALSSARENMLVQQQIEQAKAGTLTAWANAQTAMSGSQVAKNQALASEWDPQLRESTWKQVAAQADKTLKEQGLVSAQSARQAMETTRSEVEARIKALEYPKAAAEAALYREHGEAIRGVEKATDILKGAGQAAGSMGGRGPKVLRRRR